MPLAPILINKTDRFDEMTDADDHAGTVKRIETGKKGIIPFDAPHTGTITG